MPPAPRLIPLLSFILHITVYCTYLYKYIVIIIHYFVKFKRIIWNSFFKHHIEMSLLLITVKNVLKLYKNPSIITLLNTSHYQCPFPVDIFCVVSHELTSTLLIYYFLLGLEINCLIFH